METNSVAKQKNFSISSAKIPPQTQLQVGCSKVESIDCWKTASMSPSITWAFTRVHTKVANTTFMRPRMLAQVDGSHSQWSIWLLLQMIATWMSSLVIIMCQLIQHILPTTHSPSRTFPSKSLVVPFWQHETRRHSGCNKFHIPKARDMFLPQDSIGLFAIFQVIKAKEHDMNIFGLNYVLELAKKRNMAMMANTIHHHHSCWTFSRG